MIKRPNILFLMSDEHRADVAGFAGNPVVRTPVLNELARTGVAFNNAYTPSPICIPARQCLMSGQLPSTCGCFHYGDDLPPGSMTFARRFSEYGYHTLVCGKLHHMGQDQMQGWRQRIAFDDIHVAPAYVENRQQEEFARTARSGLKWSDAKEVLRAGVGKSPHAIADEFSVSGAIQFLELFYNNAFYDKEQGQTPLLLKVSLLQPHYPYFTDEAKFGYYLNRVEPFLNQVVFDHPVLSLRQVKVGEEVSERDVRRATAAYYGMVESIDEYYGQVLETLRRVGQDLDDWVIIYTSDHGEMLGEHGIWEKQKFFEGSVRVPLIIRWPSRFAGGRVVSENVNLCDLFATLCELADLPVPEGLDSRSLCPLLEGIANEWEDETVSQFGKNRVMIKWGDLKYQNYGEEGEEVLFDLAKDPGEMRNAIDDGAYGDAVGRFRSRLAQLNAIPNRVVRA